MRGFGRVALDLVEIRKAYRNGVKTTIVHPNAINTGMFDGIKLRLQWLVPMLEPRDVAEAVIDAALAGKVHMMDRSRCVRPGGERESSLERCIDCTWRSLCSSRRVWFCHGSSHARLRSYASCRTCYGTAPWISSEPAREWSPLSDDRTRSVRATRKPCIPQCVALCKPLLSRSVFDYWSLLTTYR